MLKQFRLDPFPTFTFEVDGIGIEKTVFMAQGENTTVVEYRVLDASPATNLRLQLRPLIAFRDYHSLTQENGAINGASQREPGLIRFSSYPGLPTLYLASNAVNSESSGYWYQNFEYEAERERSLDFAEDFREPDAGNLPVRFDEQEQETGPGQTGLRRRRESFVTGHRETKATAPVLDSTPDFTR